MSLDLSIINAMVKKLVANPSNSLGSPSTTNIGGAEDKTSSTPGIASSTELTGRGASSSDESKMNEGTGRPPPSTTSGTGPSITNTERAEDTRSSTPGTPSPSAERTEHGASSSEESTKNKGSGNHAPRDSSPPSTNSGTGGTKEVAVAKISTPEGSISNDPNKAANIAGTKPLQDLAGAAASTIHHTASSSNTAAPAASHIEYVPHSGPTPPAGVIIGYTGTPAVNSHTVYASIPWSYPSGAATTYGSFEHARFAQTNNTIPPVSPYYNVAQSSFMTSNTAMPPAGGQWAASAMPQQPAMQMQVPPGMPASSTTYSSHGGHLPPGTPLYPTLAQTNPATAGPPSDVAVADDDDLDAQLTKARKNLHNPQAAREADASTLRKSQSYSPKQTSPPASTTTNTTNRPVFGQEPPKEQPKESARSDEVVKLMQEVARLSQEVRQVSAELAALQVVKDDTARVREMGQKLTVEITAVKQDLQTIRQDFDRFSESIKKALHEMKKRNLEIMQSLASAFERIERLDLSGEGEKSHKRSKRDDGEHEKKSKRN